MRKLLITLVFVPLVAHAEFLPEGCYVAYNNPNYCWTTNAPTIAWQTTGDLVYLYGTAVATIIQNANLKDAALASCNSDFNNAIALAQANLNDRNACLGNLNTCNSSLSGADSQYNQLYANYLSWVKYGKAKASLAAKLKRACGSACKRIR